MIFIKLTQSCCEERFFFFFFFSFWVLDYYWSTILIYCIIQRIIMRFVLFLNSGYNNSNNKKTSFWNFFFFFKLLAYDNYKTTFHIYVMQCNLKYSVAVISPCFYSPFILFHLSWSKSALFFPPKKKKKNLLCASSQPSNWSRTYLCWWHQSKTTLVFVEFFAPTPIFPCIQNKQKLSFFIFGYESKFI